MECTYCHGKLEEFRHTISEKYVVGKCTDCGKIHYWERTSDENYASKPDTKNERRKRKNGKWKRKSPEMPPLP